MRVKAYLFIVQQKYGKPFSKRIHYNIIYKAHIKNLASDKQLIFFTKIHGFARLFWQSLNAYLAKIPEIAGAEFG